MKPAHRETHVTHRIGWLRAAVLGANDGLVSTASLLMGVAAAGADNHTTLMTGVAGLSAGAMAMAAGEYVSVSSQADTEKAELERERAELEADSKREHAELVGIYMQRGLDQALATQVADQLHARDALAAHARDELGIANETAARPVQAALASAATFAIGAVLPLAAILLAPAPWKVQTLAGATLVFLALLGAVGARAGGAPILRASLRVLFWGALAMAVTAGIGHLFGVQAA